MVLIKGDMRIGALGAILGSGGWAAIQGTALFAGGVLWSTPAAADCALPQPALAFSYPDSTTERVPANAVFWAAGTTGAVALVSLDGVELSPLGAALHERVQFAPQESLALGSHELTITVPRHPQAGDTDTPAATETFRFEVTEPDSFDANPEIVSVTTYPILFSPGQRPHPPEEAYEGDCSARVVDLGASCFDIIPESLVRVELAPDPRARGYVMGNYLLPADCEVFFPYQYAQPGDAPYSVAAILPTGLGAEAAFEGTAERVEYDPSPGTYRDGPPGWCTLSFGARSPGSVGSIMALGWAALLLRRRVRPAGLQA